MKKAEIVLICVAIAGFIISLVPLPGGNLLKVLSVTLLSQLYFYFGFALFNNIRFREIFKKSSYANISRMRIFGAIGAGFALSVLTIGILFKLMHWPGGSMMLLIGLLTGLAISIAVVAKYLTGKSGYYLSALKRMVPFTIVGIAFYFIPSIIWVEMAYRDNPEYLEAYRNAYANPDDQELWKKVEEEQRKMEE